MKIEGDTVTLSNGKTFNANKGLLSVSESGVLHEGYDGCDIGFWSDEKDAEEPPSLEERREIAEFMIDRWKKWAVL